MNSERGEISRRNFLKLAGGAGTAVALGATIGCTELEQNSRKYDGKPIEGEEVKQYYTANFDGGDEVILRENPDMGDEAQLNGKDVVAQPNYIVNAQPVYGVTYPSGDSDEGKFVRLNGNWYGRWYQIEAVPVFQESENGEYIPVGVGRGFYTSGNFLTRAGDEADNRQDAR